MTKVLGISLITFLINIKYNYNIVTYLALAYVIMYMLVFSNYFQQLTNKNVKKVETVE